MSKHYFFDKEACLVFAVDDASDIITPLKKLAAILEGTNKKIERAVKNKGGRPKKGMPQSQFLPPAGESHDIAIGDEPRELHKGRRLTDEQKADIERRIKEGESKQTTVNECGISESLYYIIKTRLRKAGAVS